MVLKERENRVRYYEPGPHFSPKLFGFRLRQLIDDVRRSEDKAEVLFLCIGSDRSTGDSLGPLIGYKLERSPGRSWHVLGTLEQPVHAMNLSATLDAIQRWYADHVVVAIDASIGQREQVGTISMGKGAIQPGLGVSKKLEQVGDVFITGVVGSGSCQEPFLLQSIRLAVVMELADTICTGIHAMRGLPVEAAAARFW